MRKLIDNQQGLGHVILILMIAVVAVIIGLVGWRVMQKNDTETSVNQSTMTEAEEDISLQNLGLASFDSIDITTNAVREYASNGLKGFYVFGDSLPGGRLNPNFEYASLKPGTKVISAIDGVVGFIKVQQDSGDSEVFIQPKEGSAWTIGYDHLTNVTVKQGQSVKAGEVLGEPAVQNNGLLRFEIQINKDQDGATTHYCPSILLNSSVKENWLAQLSSMQDSWESVTGLELYDTSAQNPIGCLKQTMTPQEAEGR